MGFGHDYDKKEEGFLDQYAIKFKKAFGYLHHNTCTLSSPNDKI